MAFAHKTAVVFYLKVKFLAINERLEGWNAERKEKGEVPDILPSFLKPTLSSFA
jgi:hypothetical protein